MQVGQCDVNKWKKRWRTVDRLYRILYTQQIVAGRNKGMWNKWEEIFIQVRFHYNSLKWQGRQREDRWCGRRQGYSVTAVSIHVRNSRRHSNRGIESKDCVEALVQDTINYIKTTEISGCLRHCYTCLPCSSIPCRGDSPHIMCSLPVAADCRSKAVWRQGTDGRTVDDMPRAITLHSCTFWYSRAAADCMLARNRSTRTPGL